MSQTSQSIKALKAKLKLKGITHQNLADQMGVKLPTIRRWLSLQEKTVRMENFERMCEIAGTSLSEILSDIDVRVDTYELDDIDEEALLADRLLMLISFLIINGWSFNSIKNNYRISKDDLLSRLVILENIGIIAKLDKESGVFIRNTTSKISWKSGGRVEKEMNLIIQEFLSKPKDRETDREDFIPATLSIEGINQVNEQVDIFIDQIHKIIEIDSHNSGSKRDGYSLYISKKKWVYSAFEDLSL